MMYEKSIIRMFFDPTYKDYVGSFELMVKTSEIYSVNWG
jgi:hypothetical protein